MDTEYAYGFHRTTDEGAETFTVSPGGIIYRVNGEIKVEQYADLPDDVVAAAVLDLLLAGWERDES